MISKVILQKFTYRGILNYIATKPIPYIFYFLKDFGVQQNRLDSRDIFQKIAGKKTISDFYGYECANFIHDYKLCKLVRPKKAAPGNPWIFRARIWELQHQVDRVLLQKGFHIAYCDLRELYGNHESNKIISSFYDYMQKLGLNAKVGIIAMSRGSFYAYSWAVEHGNKISCIYADNPPLDFRSWPGGIGKGTRSIPDWKKFKKMHGLKGDDEANGFNGNPVDMAPEIAKYKFPILHVCGEKDEYVPLEENTIPFQEKILKNGGNIKVIVKPGAGHHPHGLNDPSEIIDFIINSTSNSIH